MRININPLLLKEKLETKLHSHKGNTKTMVF